VRSALLLRYAADRAGLLLRLLRKARCRAWRILPEPAVLVGSKRLRPRHIGSRSDRIVGFTDVCLPHQILPEVRPT
jgi:hypothetical protein